MVQLILKWFRKKEKNKILCVYTGIYVERYSKSVNILITGD